MFQIVVAAALIFQTAYAEEPKTDRQSGGEDLGVLNGAEDLWKLLERLPADNSWDISVSAGFGEITYWRDYTEPWLGFGVRGVWGKHIGDQKLHRFGVGGAIGADGPVPEFTSLYVDPSANWDFVHPNGFAVGLSIGPSLLTHVWNKAVDQEVKFGVAPSLAFRMGWSQPFSRTTRRVFIMVEPRVRWVRNHVNPFVSIVVGSGKGY